MCSNCGRDHPQPAQVLAHDHDHSHAHHGHDHGHDHGTTVEHNQEYFDALAEKYESVKGGRELVAQLGTSMRNAVHLDTESTHVLDFACGVGKSMLSNIIFWG